MSQQLSNQQSQEAVREQKVLRKQVEDLDLTMEQMVELSHLFQSSSWRSYLKCLRSLEVELGRRIWGRHLDHDETMFVRGQMDTLIGLKRLPLRVTEAKDALIEKNKETKDLQ